MLLEFISPNLSRALGVLEVILLPVALYLSERVKFEIDPAEKSFKALAVPFLIGLLSALIQSELPLFIIASEIALPFYYVAAPQKLLGHFAELSLKSLILLMFASEAASFLLFYKLNPISAFLSISLYFFSRFLNAALCSEILRSKGYGNIGAVIPSFFSVPGLVAVLLLKGRKKKRSVFID